MGIQTLKEKLIITLKNKKTRQIIMLFSVNIATIPIGITTSIVLSHYLGPTGYGDYQFLDNIFTFSVLIFTLGFFHAANRALVLNEDKQKAKEYYGATMMVLVAIFLLMSMSLTLYALLDSNIKAKHLDKILLYSIPLGWAYLALNYFETLFQADNRINLLATARLLPKIGFLISAAIIYWLLMHKGGDKLFVAWGFYLLMQVLACIYVIFKIKLSFKNLKDTLAEIWNYNKTYGFHVYIGAAFSVGVASLTGVLISYFSKTNSGVGFYVLALNFASPLQFIPNTIATTNYKEFSVQSRIPKKLTQLTMFLTGLALVGVWIVVPPFIYYFYGTKFQPVILLNFIVSIGIAFYGLADYYNRYLAAHGHGKLLRNTSFIVGSLILVFNIVLIPRFGAKGAALTRLLGGAAYFACMLYYYGTIVKENKKKENALI